MAAPNLVPRILDYFERQSTWARQCLEAVKQLETALEEEGAGLDDFARAQALREEQYMHFHREYRGLIDEWARAQNISDEERVHVRRRAREVEQCNHALAKEYERCGAMAEKAKCLRRDTLKTLRRGKNNLGKYRSDWDEPPGYIDRQA
jgi:hypothetical protein